MFQNDSIVVAAANTDGQKSVIRQHAGQPTPHQVLSWLPRDATPEQQDSAIQMHIKPSEIHWSANPDTLHLPGQTKGKSFRGVSLPQYFDNLNDALASIKRINRWRIADQTEIDPSTAHTLVFKFKLDLSELPRPFQIGLIGNNDWFIETSKSLRFVAENIK